MVNLSLFLFVIFLLKLVNCLTNPAITEWTRSTGVGYGGFKTNVYRIEYSSDFVWISTNSIPSFLIGPWANNPNDAKGKNYTFKFPLSPTYNIQSPTEVPLGHIGLWINGVSAFNADDGMTYNNLGVWKRNAYVFEGVSFDSCLGHPDQNSEYHNHISSSCLYNTSSSSHSPLIGYAFDGFPIYGPYGYSSANDSNSSIKRIETSYKLRSITERTSLPNGVVLDSSLYGPSISEFPLSSFIEDYEYQTDYGDLDEYNGRYCKTPEYPDGIYAYFIATDSSLTPVYPFIVGPYYRGNVLPGNIGPDSGNLSPKSALLYYEYVALSNSNLTNSVFTTISSSSSSTVSSTLSSSTISTTISSSSSSTVSSTLSSSTISTTTLQTMTSKSSLIEKFKAYYLIMLILIVVG